MKKKTTKVTKKPKNMKLDAYEQMISDEIAKGNYKRAENEKEIMEDLRAAAKEAVKDTRINLRINRDDLDRLVKEANRKGMPYQTLLGSIIHLYAEGQLIDVVEAKKIVGKK